MDWVVLGKQIRELRRRNSLTQQAVAEVADVSHTFVSHLEKGRRNATIETLEKIVSAAGGTLRVVAAPVDVAVPAGGLTAEERALVARLARAIPYLSRQDAEREVRFLEMRAGVEPATESSEPPSPPPRTGTVHRIRRARAK